jgi:hypothetical protein
MIEITNPERWLILRITGTDDYKVLGTWAGGYLGSDRWRVNSGIKSMEFHDPYYIFTGASGSQYKCSKGSYGTIQIGLQVIEQLGDKVEVLGGVEDLPIYDPQWG